MKSIKLPVNWEEKKVRLKWNFRHLTENDLSYKRGKEEELIFKLQKKLGTRQEEVIEILNRI
jgi:uncharacterized protein YjbJ (UPF0337 family)